MELKHQLALNNWWEDEIIDPKTGLTNFNTRLYQISIDMVEKDLYMQMISLCNEYGIDDANNLIYISSYIRRQSFGTIPRDYSSLSQVDFVNNKAQMRKGYWRQFRKFYQLFKKSMEWLFVFDHIQEIRIITKTKKNEARSKPIVINGLLLKYLLESTTDFVKKVAESEEFKVAEENVVGKGNKAKLINNMRSVYARGINTHLINVIKDDLTRRAFIGKMLMAIGYPISFKYREYYSIQELKKERVTDLSISQFVRTLL